MDKLDIDNKFIIIPEWILLSDLSDKSKVLYGALWKYADRNTNKCFPSRKTLARDLNCHESSVDRCVKELVKLGAIEVFRRPPKENGANQSNLYLLKTTPTSVSNDTPTSVDNDTPLVAHKELTKTNITKTNNIDISKEQRGAMWIAIEKNMGYKPTSLQRGQWNKALKVLIESGFNRPEQVDDLFEAYKTNMKDWTITPLAIAKYSNELRSLAEEKKKKQERIENPCKNGHSWIEDTNYKFRYCLRCLTESKL